MLVARLAQPFEELLARRTDAALALDRLDQEAGGMLVDQRQCPGQIVELGIFEARQQRLEPVAHLRLVGRADRAECPAVEGGVKRDQVMPLGIAVHEVIAPRGLDRAFHRLGARIGEEHRVGKTRIDQPLREVLALRGPVQVRHVHQRRRLLGDRLDQLGMAVAKRIHRNAAGEIEILLALFAVQIHALAAHRAHAATRVHRH
jgi:hypothetical protein